jgi:alkanesulfonate monooxygenase SsuD/methylene tetrahydromethanopterin reductase-like flavin-dependent oxidoreductase (luciferase family)
MNLMSNVGVAQMRQLSDTYRQTWSASGASEGEMPMIGMNRHLVIADTDAKALDIARRAYRKWHSNFMYLWNLHGQKPKIGGYPDDFDGLAAEGRGIAGSPDTVLRELAKQIDASGINYFVGRFCFGDLTTAEVLRSLDLFSRQQQISNPASGVVAVPAARVLR